MRGLIPSAIPSAISAAVALTTVVFLFLGFNDADLIQRVFRIDLATSPENKIIISQIAFVLRVIICIILFILVALFIVIFARRDSQLPATRQNHAPSEVGPIVLPQSDALELVEASLKKTRGAVELNIWGFSLGWATPLYRFLRDNGHPTLTIRLFVTGEYPWSLNMDYGSVTKTALKA